MEEDTPMTNHLSRCLLTYTTVLVIFTTSSTVSNAVDQTTKLSYYQLQYLCNTSDSSSWCATCSLCGLQAFDGDIQISCHPQCTVPAYSCRLSNGSSSSLPTCEALTTVSARTTPEQNTTSSDAAANTSTKEPFLNETFVSERPAASASTTKSSEVVSITAAVEMLTQSSEPRPTTYGVISSPPAAAAITSFTSAEESVTIAAMSTSSTSGRTPSGTVLQTLPSAPGTSASFLFTTDVTSAGAPEEIKETSRIPTESTLPTKHSTPITHDTAQLTITSQSDSTATTNLVVTPNFISTGASTDFLKTSSIPGIEDTTQLISSSPSPTAATTNLVVTPNFISTGASTDFLTTSSIPGIEVTTQLISSPPSPTSATTNLVVTPNFISTGASTDFLTTSSIPGIEVTTQLISSSPSPTAATAYLVVTPKFISTGASTDFLTTSSIPGIEVTTQLISSPPSPTAATTNLVVTPNFISTGASTDFLTTSSIPGIEDTTQLISSSPSPTAATTNLVVTATLNSVGVSYETTATSPMLSSTQSVAMITVITEHGSVDSNVTTNKNPLTLSATLFGDITVAEFGGLLVAAVVDDGLLAATSSSVAIRANTSPLSDAAATSSSVAARSNTSPLSDAPTANSTNMVTTNTTETSTRTTRNAVTTTHVSPTTALLSTTPDPPSSTLSTTTPAPPSSKLSTETPGLLSSTLSTTTPEITTPSGSSKVDLVDVYFTMLLTVSFDISFDDDLNDPNSDTYRECSVQVEDEINEAFGECPGFSASKTAVLGFFSGSTVANISTGYNATYVLESEESSVAINQYIFTYALPQLNNATLTVNKTIGRVNSTYLATQTASEVNSTTALFLSYEKDPCDADDWCTVCSLCGFQVSKGLLENIYCYPLCQAPAYTCYVTDVSLTTSATCGCSQYYLLMAGNCVDQNIIIGVFAGVGGALLVGLTFALIWACCKPKPKRDSHMVEISEDSRSRSSSEGSLHVKSELTDEPSLFNPTIVQLTPVDELSTTLPTNAEASSQDVYCDNVPECLQETDIYRDFTPQLQNVHEYTPIVIARPKLVNEQHSVQLPLTRLQLMAGRFSSHHQDVMNEEEKYF